MIPVLTLRGDAYAVGYGLGTAVADFVRTELIRLPAWRALRPWLGSDRLKAMEDLARRVLPRHVRELEGLADGIGLPFRELFLWNCRGDLPGREATGGEPGGCTTVAVPGPKTHLIGHNEDGHPAYRGRWLLVRVLPEWGPGFTSFVYPGSLPGNSFAVNGAGLVQTINNLRAEDRRIGLPRQLMARAVLDADGLDAALALLKRTDRAAGYHHLLAQAGDRRLLSVEAPASAVSILELIAPAAHANHLVAPSLAGIPQRITLSSAARQRQAEALAAALPAQPGPADLCRLLGDRGDPELPIHRNDPNDGDEENTLATAVFAIRPSAVDWRIFDHKLDRPIFAVQET